MSDGTLLCDQEVFELYAEIVIDRDDPLVCIGSFFREPPAVVLRADPGGPEEGV